MKEFKEAAEAAFEQMAEHAKDCHAPWGCISCGCDRTGRLSGNPHACVDHEAMS